MYLLNLRLFLAQHLHPRVAEAVVEVFLRVNEEAVF